MGSDVYVLHDKDILKSVVGIISVADYKGSNCVPNWHLCGSVGRVKINMAACLCD